MNQPQSRLKVLPQLWMIIRKMERHWWTVPVKEKQNRKKVCCPRVKKKQDRYFQIICGVGALVFGTLILGIPSYVVLKAALASGKDAKGQWKGFPEKLDKTDGFYQHTKSQALNFGYFLSSISGIFIIMGIVIISYNACCVKNLPEEKRNSEGNSHSTFMHYHHAPCDMELTQRNS